MARNVKANGHAKSNREKDGLHDPAPYTHGDPMQTNGFQSQDLQRFSAVQKLAYEVVEAVQAQLLTGMTEKDAVRLLRAELSRAASATCSTTLRLVRRAHRFKNFWINLKFLPSKTRLQKGMPVILDIAPIIDGYSADIGYRFVHGGDPVIDQMDRVLLQVRDHILGGGARRQDHARHLPRGGHADRGRRLHQRAPLLPAPRDRPPPGRIQVGAMHRLRWLGFGPLTHVSLDEPHLAVQAVPQADRVAAVERRPRMRPCGCEGVWRWSRTSPPRPAPGHQVGGDPGRDPGQRPLAQRRRHTPPPCHGQRLVKSTQRPAVDAGAGLSEKARRPRVGCGVSASGSALIRGRPLRRGQRHPVAAAALGVVAGRVGGP